MFGCYSELVACAHNSVQENDLEPPTSQISDLHLNSSSPLSPFGGFQTWPSQGKDFVLLAECSEVNGPNPLFTIPSQDFINVDLNTVCLHILSADYQGLGCDPAIPTACTQLLMPDVMTDVHVAVSHFIVFDTKARGFVRPLCLAYISSDKFKLMELADQILKNLTLASSFIRSSNKIFIEKEFENLLLNLELKKNKIGDFCQSSSCPPQRSQGCNIETCIKDVQHAMGYVHKIKVVQDLQIKNECFLQQIKDNVSEEIYDNIVASFNPLPSHEAEESQFSFQQDFGKMLRGLTAVCSGGIILSIYHMFIMHKYFQRDYENIFMQTEEQNSKEASQDNMHGNSLHFGACLRSTCSSEYISRNKCLFTGPNIPSTFDIDNIGYFFCINSEFGNIVADFLHGQNLKRISGSHDSNKLSSVNLKNDDYVTFPKMKCVTFEPTISDCHSSHDSGPHSFGLSAACQQHICTLGNVWDTLDLLEERKADVVFSEILGIFQQSDSLFFSLLTRTMIVVVSSSKEMQVAQLFIETLAVFVPRAKNDAVWVELNRKIPLEKQDLVNLTVVGFCLSKENSLTDFVSADLMPFISVLNLRDRSYSGPKYTGCLLSSLDDRLKSAEEGMSIFPVLISLLSEVELKVKFWLSIVSSSLSTSIATHHLIQKGFTSCDMQIVQKLSKYCMP